MDPALDSNFNSQGAWISAGQLLLITQYVIVCRLSLRLVESNKTECRGHNRDLFFPLDDGFVFFVYCGPAGDLRLGPRS